ncbi:MAG: 30S ribosomal protein S18 [Verrucomicrobia bacterium]|nr:30S ribosomal protein S18 [Verrucomicrobiota bacterium]MDA1087953.1 30S ribosomal protein S18 [Verrucomicrobiota bacterium]
MARDDRGGGGGRNSRFTEVRKKRVRELDGLKRIDRGDHEFLRNFLTEQGKIIPARLTGANPSQQRQIKRAIRRARVMGFMM